MAGSSVQSKWYIGLEHEPDVHHTPGACPWGAFIEFPCRWGNRLGGRFCIGMGRCYLRNGLRDRGVNATNVFNYHASCHNLVYLIDPFAWMVDHILLAGACYQWQWRIGLEYGSIVFHASDSTAWLTNGNWQGWWPH